MNQREFKEYVEKLQREQRTKFGEVCDFCGQPPGAWVFLAYKAYAGWENDMPMEFAPEWIACEECKRLIEAGNRAALIERACHGFAVSMISEDLPEEQRNDFASHRPEIEQIHNVFFANRVNNMRPVRNRPENLRPN